MPILFTVFINDITSVVRKYKCLIFADDTKLYYKIVSEEDSRELQLVLQRLCKDGGKITVSKLI